MAGPVAGWGDDTAARERRGRMRASHADREQVVDRLKAGYAYGLLTKDEFDARVGQTFATRTYAELDLVTIDIPVGLPAAPPPPARARAAATTAPADRKARWVDRALAAAALLAALAFVVATLTDNVFIGLGAAVSALTSLFLTGTRALSARRDAGSGRELPPPQAAIGPGSAAGTPPAITARRPRQHREPRRRGSADARLSLRPELAS
jgi:Domain of unknown function (DUF1707)